MGEPYMSEVRLIDANKLIYEIKKHSVWNSEGVVELIKKMPTMPALEVKYRNEKNKGA